MEEKANVSNAIEEIKNASEDDLKEVIENWFESTRTAGMKIGASYISAAVYGAIKSNLKNGSKSSLRDYQRAIKRVVEIVSVQLTQQNDSWENENDGAMEDN